MKELDRHPFPNTASTVLRVKKSAEGRICGGPWGSGVPECSPSSAHFVSLFALAAGKLRSKLKAE